MGRSVEATQCSAVENKLMGFPEEEIKPSGFVVSEMN